MLVLTRREGESIMIGEDVEIEVVEIRRGKVRLGVRAPIKVAVHRREVFEKVMTSVWAAGTAFMGMVKRCARRVRGVDRSERGCRGGSPCVSGACWARLGF